MFEPALGVRVYSTEKVFKIFKRIIWEQLIGELMVIPIYTGLCERTEKKLWFEA